MLNNPTKIDGYMPHSNEQMKKEVMELQSNDVRNLLSVKIKKKC